jgi:hypothetical protein
MAEIVNLRQARKARARAGARAQADANALRFGRTAAQKAREEADAARAKAELDGKRRDPGPEGET